MDYRWTFEPGDAGNLLQDFDFTTYAVEDDVDHSISIDVMAFFDVVEEETYAFILTSITRIIQLYRYMSSPKVHALSPIKLLPQY